MISPRAFAVAAIATLSAPAACGGSTPETRFYQLEIGTQAPQSGGDVVMVVEPFTVDAAYDDDRIVYRPSPFRLDYYYYHRWSAPPGELVADTLREAYRRTGQFARVTNELGRDADVMLSGRVLALEEVDVTRTDWSARIALELRLRDARTGEVIWSEIVRETVPLDEQNPAGLTRALSVAIWDIARETSTEIIVAAERNERGMRDAVTER